NSATVRFAVSVSCCKTRTSASASSRPGRFEMPLSGTIQLRFAIATPPRRIGSQVEAFQLLRWRLHPFELASDDVAVAILEDWILQRPLLARIGDEVEELVVGYVRAIWQPTVVQRHVGPHGNAVKRHVVGMAEVAPGVGLSEPFARDEAVVLR